MISRNGNVVAFVTEDTSANTLDQIIDNNVSSDAVIVTDGYKGYNHLHKKFNHVRVKQGNSYVIKDGDNEYHTQTIESFWATHKRGYVGIYHYMSGKHLNKYVNEYAYRYNNKDLTVSEKFGKSMSLYSRSHITYKELIKKLAA